MKYGKRFVTLGVLIALASYMPTLIGAEDLNGQLQEVQQKMEQQQAAKAEAEVRIENFSAQLKVVQDSLEQANRELRAIQKRRATTEAAIEENERALREAQERYQKRMRILEKRARDIYENGQFSYLDVIFGAQSFNDFATRWELFKRLLQSDVTLIQSVKAERTLIEEKKAALETQRQEILSLEREAEAKKSIIVEKKREEEALLARAQNDHAVALAALEELENASASIKARIQALEAQRSGGSDSTQQVVTGSGQFSWPVSGPITSPFGYRTHPIYGRQILHSGIDIGVPTGTVVHAADSGTVILSGWVSGYGYTVIIDHGNGFSTLYGHNSELIATEGEHVSKGQPIAYAGSTGNSTGPHVHFEVRVHGDPVDPMGYL